MGGGGVVDGSERRTHGRLPLGPERRRKYLFHCKKNQLFLLLSCDVIHGDVPLG